MRSAPRTLWLLALVTALAAAAAIARAPRERDAVFQASTIGALLAGVFDGDTTFAELARHGDFGLGTFNELDGEMVAVDGRYYQVRTDGRAVRVAGTQRTPFAVVKWFRADRTLSLEGAASLAELERLLEGAISSPNVLTAIRIEGRFPDLSLRSVPRQTRPYPGLLEATRRQTTFALREVDGVLVGFRTPAYMADLNVAGYHFHFLSRDRSTGGHVLACSIGRARVQLDEARGFRLVLPATREFDRAPLGTQSQEELDRAERGRR